MPKLLAVRFAYDYILAYLCFKEINYGYAVKLSQLS